MALSLVVIAGATETGNGSVSLKTKKTVNGNEVTYTFTLDASNSKGVGALEFYVKPTGLEFKKRTFPEGQTLKEVFEGGNEAGEGLNGTADFKGDQNYFIAYGGNAAKGRVLKGTVDLVSVTYTINNSNYSLEVTGFKACLSGEQAALKDTRYDCVAEPVDGGSTGVTVSGTALSWNKTDDAVYLLYPAATTEDAIKTEWKNGSYTGTACTSKGGIEVSGKQYGQSFTFGNVAAGDYKLAILKPGKYVPKIVAITVGTTDLALDEMKLWLYGDVNYDGKVNSRDAVQILRYDAGNRTFTAEEVAAANVNQDKTANSRDAVQVLRYDAGNSSTLDSIK